MDDNPEMEPKTPAITEKTLAKQPITEDPYEVDLGDYEMSEDESNETE